MEWKSEAEWPIFKHRLLLCCPLHLHPGFDAPSPKENTKDVGRRKSGFYYKTFFLTLRKWKALPDHSVHDGERINAYSENTKAWSFDWWWRSNPVTENGKKDGNWLWRTLPAQAVAHDLHDKGVPGDFSSRVCAELSLCSILRTVLCIWGGWGKDSDIMVALTFLILAVFINFLCQLQVLYKAYHKKY